MLPHTTTLLEIFVRCVIVYSFLLLAFRLSGKRQMGQMTPFDLVLLLLVSNAVQNAMTGPDTSIVGGLVAAGTLIGANVLVAKILPKTGILERWVEGTPTLLILDGTVIPEHLRKEGITQPELEQALREHGVEAIPDVKSAILEIDGTISVVRLEDVHANHSSRPYHRIRYQKHHS